MHVDTQTPQLTSRCNTLHYDLRGWENGGVQAHSHSAIMAALAGCDVVLCGGMGWRAAEALKAGGICAVPVSASGSAEELVAAYAAGSLITSDGSFCRCSH